MLLTPIAAPAGAATRVVPPKGAYKGATEQEGQIKIEISKNRKYVKLIFFQVACDEAGHGSTGLQNLKLKKTKKGYKFGGSAQSAVIYSDDAPAEEGTVAVVGRFSKNGKALTGAFQVETPRCGDSGPVRYIAAR